MADFMPPKVIYHVMMHCNGRDMRALSLVNRYFQQQNWAFCREILRAKPVLYNQQCIDLFVGNRDMVFISETHLKLTKLIIEGPQYAFWHSPIHRGRTTSIALYIACALCMDDGAYIYIEVCGRRSTEDLIKKIYSYTPTRFWKRNKIIILDEYTKRAPFPKLYRIVSEYPTDRITESMVENALSVRIGLSFNADTTHLTRISLQNIDVSRMDDVTFFTCTNAADCISATKRIYTIDRDEYSIGRRAALNNRGPIF